MSSMETQTRKPNGNPLFFYYQQEIANSGKIKPWPFRFLRMDPSVKLWKPLRVNMNPGTVLFNYFELKHSKSE